MRDFKYVRATTVDEAVSALSIDNSAVVAGGTALLNYLKAMVSPNAPDVLVDIKSIPDLRVLKEEGGMLKIGALVKLADIAESPLVQDRYTALAEAARRAGTPQLRNMGTIGGNICQFVRCWYYRAEHNAFPCLRKNPIGACYALNGDNRYHSIFGAVNGCMAVNPSNTAPALVALNAKIKTSKRTVNAEDFFAVNGEKTTVIYDDELVTEIQIPTPTNGTKSAFLKFALRKAFDFPIVNCAVVIRCEGDTVMIARICLNAVYNVPYRATAAEEALIGKSIDESSAESAGIAAASRANALTHNKYMIKIAKTVVKRAILACR